MARRSNRTESARQRGMTLVEVMIAVTIIAILSSVVFGLADTALKAWAQSNGEGEIYRQGSLTMEYLAIAVRSAHRVLVPLENATGVTSHDVLALAMPCDDCDFRTDGDFDCIDDDGDGRYDEDGYQDMNRDGRPGINGIDDEYNGTIDDLYNYSGAYRNDDEDVYCVFYMFGHCWGYSLNLDEDPLDNFDNDGDNFLDEDWPSDINGDGYPGKRYFDDDGDGSVDEGNDEDDDEDGQTNEDAFNPILIYHDTGTDELILEHPVYKDDGNCSRDDYDEMVLATDVTDFHVTLLSAGNGVQIVQVSLEITRGDDVVTLGTSIYPRNTEAWVRWKY